LGGDAETTTHLLDVGKDNRRKGAREKEKKRPVFHGHFKKEKRTLAGTRHQKIRDGKGGSFWGRKSKGEGEKVNPNRQVGAQNAGKQRPQTKAQLVEKRKQPRKKGNGVGGEIS